MRTLSILAIVLMSLSTHAQKSNPRPYIQLMSGETIEGKDLIFHSSSNSESVFQLDGVMYPSKDVEFFKNKHGYFANLGRIEGFEKPSFAMRIDKGRTNLYQRIDIDVYGGPQLKPGSKGEGLSDGTAFQYYNVGDEPLRKVGYSNMKVDLADNLGASAHLKDYRKFRLLQFGLIGGGAGVLASSVASQAGQAFQFNPMMLLGVLMSGSSLLLESPKDDALWLAADEYNRDRGYVAVGGGY
ncbi:MAG: hypothetical protein RL040_106 [Bacteroidota bacterium]